MPALGALCDIARNLFYLLTVVLIGYMVYSFYKGHGLGMPTTTYIAVAWVACLVIWQATKAKLA